MAGENAYTTWKDGAPVTGPTSEGAFTDWLDGRPVTLYASAGGATDLVIPDAAHLHVADNIALTQVYTIVVADADHLHTADGLAITQDHTLVVAEAYHLHDADNLDLQWGLTLQIAEAYHDLIDDGPLALTQDHTLAVAESDHLQDADSIVLTAQHLLTVAECYHVHAPPNLTLTQQHHLAVDDGTHLHTAPNINLILSDVTLAGLDSYSLLVDDAPDLTTNDETIELFDYGVAGSQAGSYNGSNWRSIGDTSAAFQQHRYIRFQFSAASNLGTTLNKVAFAARDTGDEYAEAATVLTFEGSESVSLSAGETAWSDWTLFTAPTGGEVLVSMLFNAATYHAQYTTTGKDSYRENTTVDETETLDFPTWGTYTDVTYTLRGAEVTENPIEIPVGTHLHVADNIVLTQEYTLVINAGDHLHTADAADAFTRTDLVVADADHLHEAETPALTQDHTLVVNAADHLHTAPNLTLSGLGLAAAEPAYHLHAADVINLVVTPGVAETEHLLTSPELTLVVGFDLVIPDSVILTESDNLAGLVTSFGSIDDGFHLHDADALVLTQDHTLTVADSYHGHFATEPDIYMVGDLPIDSAVHATDSDNIDLGGSQYLVVADAYHLHTVDGLLGLGQAHFLDMDAAHSFHLHFADNVVIAALAADFEATWMDSATQVRTIHGVTASTIIDAVLAHTLNTVTTTAGIDTETSFRRLDL